MGSEKAPERVGSTGVWVWAAGIAAVAVTHWAARFLRPDLIGASRTALAAFAASAALGTLWWRVRVRRCARPRPSFGAQTALTGSLMGLFSVVCAEAFRQATGSPSSEPTMGLRVLLLADALALLLAAAWGAGRWREA